MRVNDLVAFSFRKHGFVGTYIGDGKVVVDITRCNTVNVSHDNEWRDHVIGESYNKAGRRSNEILDELIESSKEKQ